MAKVLKRRLRLGKRSTGRLLTRWTDDLKDDSEKPLDSEGAELRSGEHKERSIVQQWTIEG